MSSLYRRATPSQARVLRIIEGAIKNTCDAHPNLQISPRHRRSIAKRAAGTLTAQWPEVLAASRGTSDSREPGQVRSDRGRVAQALKPLGRGGADCVGPSPLGRFPVRRLIADLARPLRAMKLAGETERVEAFVEALKIIDRLRRHPA